MIFRIRLVSPLLAALLFGCTPLTLRGQLVSGDAFLQGRHVELGVNSCGGLGTLGGAPTGYPPRGGPATALALVADPAKDGFDSAGYVDDYLLAGYPNGGWALAAGSQVWGSNRAGSSITTCIGLGASSGLTGYVAVVDSLPDGTRRAIWMGSDTGIILRKEFLLGKNAVHFLVRTTVFNTGVPPVGRGLLPAEKGGEAVVGWLDGGKLFGRSDGVQKESTGISLSVLGLRRRKPDIRC